MSNLREANMSDDRTEIAVLHSMGLLRAGYEHIKQLSDQLSQRNPSDREFTDLLQKIRQGRDEIESIQRQSKPDYDHYLQSRPHASPAVKKLTDELAQLIQGLVIQFTNMENEARTSQQKLLPIVNENLRAVQMKSAYSQHVV